MAPDDAAISKMAVAAKKDGNREVFRVLEHP